MSPAAPIAHLPTDAAPRNWTAAAGSSRTVTSIWSTRATTNQPAGGLLAEAKRAGHSERTLRRAKATLSPPAPCRADCQH